MVLVKFSNLQVRNDVIQRCKQLKGSGTVILEDLTQLNVELLHRLKNNKHIKQSWSWMGGSLVLHRMVEKSNLIRLTVLKIRLHQLTIEVI